MENQFFKYGYPLFSNNIKVSIFYSLVFLKTLYNNQTYVSLVQINHINSMLQLFQNVKNNVITKIFLGMMLQCIIIRNPI